MFHFYPFFKNSIITVLKKINYYKYFILENSPLYLPLSKICDWFSKSFRNVLITLKKKFDFTKEYDRNLGKIF